MTDGKPGSPGNPKAPGAPGGAQPATAPKPSGAPAQAAPGGPRPAPGSSPFNRPGLPYKKAPSTRVTLSKGGSKVGVSLRAQTPAEEVKKKEEDKEKERLAAIPVEQRVFMIPGMKDVVEPKMFDEFLEKVVPKLRLGATGWGILEAFSNVDVTAERVCQVVHANPYYEYHFQKVIESLSKRTELPSLEGSVVLLGMQNFRNLVVGLQLSRTIHGTHAQFDEGGKLKLSPADTLKYALKAEDLILSAKGDYADMAFAAGLIYDFFAMLADATAADKKKALAYIDVVFVHSLRTAQIANEVVKLVPDFGFRKYLFSACLVHDIGKVAMAVLNQEYVDFVETARKREWPRAVRQFVEHERFGLEHAMLGSVICHHFKLFRQIEKVVSYHHEPHLLKNRNKNHYQLASLVCLATNIANNFKKTDKADDPVLAAWKGPELQDFRVDIKGVAALISKSVNI